MIKEYFEKQQEELLDQKADYEKRYIHMENQIKEIEKFIDLLEEKNDPNFESFTPRDINKKNKMKIKSLLEEKKNLILNKNDILSKINDCKRKMDELQAMIHSLKKEQNQKKEEERFREKNEAIKLSLLKYVSREKGNELKYFFPFIFSEVTDINEKLKQVLNWMDLDRIRSKVELQQILKKVDYFQCEVERYSVENKPLLETKFLSLLDQYVRESNEKNEYQIQSKCNDYFSLETIEAEQSLFELLTYIIEVLVKSFTDLNQIFVNQEDEMKIEISIHSVNKIEEDNIIELLENNELIQIYLYLLSITMRCKCINPDSLTIYLENA